MTSSLKLRSLHLIVISLLVVLSASLVAPARSAEARGRQAPAVFVTGRIYEYTQLEGQPQWVRSSMQNFQRATWAFYNDGTFAFLPANSRDDLYPLYGTYSGNGSTFTFSAVKQVQIGSTGTAMASVEGQIDVSGRSPVVELVWYTQVVNAASVNGAQFGNTSTSAYSILATLAPAR